MSYYLLTGRPIFQAKTIVEVCTKHLKQMPARPSRLSARPLPADLEDVVMACLAKDPAERPASAATVRDLLAGCADAASWGPGEARRWWAAHGAEILGPEQQASREALSRGAVSLDIDLRTRVS